MSGDCIFCKIIRGDIPARIEFQDDAVIVFQDINPAAPRHLLGAPCEHIETSWEFTGERGALLGRLFEAMNSAAKKSGLAENGYRIVLNCGPDGQQEVPHVHFHLLAGRPTTWPPG